MSTHRIWRNIHTGPNDLIKEAVEPEEKIQENFVELGV